LQLSLDLECSRIVSTCITIRSRI